MAQGSTPADHTPYQIDETVTMEELDNSQYYVWDLPIDPDTADEFVLRAISRDGVDIRALVLPDEEVEHFENGDTVWYEFRGEPATKLREEIHVDESDGTPFHHNGNYALVVTTKTDEPDDARVTVKFRSVEPGTNPME